ncbi:hypothetical protein ACH4C6_28665 [Streptomyces sp. NPDC017943]|uniref:hypothetical protein n=1 Tax=Streptomyces sp. NPDC017943 TaxID=3365019 RepID=UPI0037B2CBCF
MLDAIRYLVGKGIKWRAMPADFPQVAAAHHRLALVCADGGYTAAPSSTAWPRSPWS